MIFRRVKHTSFFWRKINIDQMSLNPSVPGGCWRSPPGRPSPCSTPPKLWSSAEAHSWSSSAPPGENFQPAGRHSIQNFDEDSLFYLDETQNQDLLLTLARI